MPLSPDSIIPLIEEQFKEHKQLGRKGKWSLEFHHDENGVPQFVRVIPASYDLRLTEKP